VRALLGGSELSGCSIRRFLLADVLTDLFQFEPDGRYCVTAGPEVLARKVAFFAAQASDAFPTGIRLSRGAAVCSACDALIESEGSAVTSAAARPAKMRRASMDTPYRSL